MRIKQTDIKFREDARDYLYASMSIEGTPFHVEAVKVHPPGTESVQTATTEKNDQWITDRLGKDGPFHTVKIDDWPGDWIVVITPYRD
jgi:hypothetical protein